MGIYDERVMHEKDTNHLNTIRTRSASCSNISSAHLSLFDDMHIRYHMEVKATARLLAEDIVRYVTVSPTPPPTCDHAKAMRHIVDEVSSRHQLVFESIVHKLGVRTERHPTEVSTCQQTFNAVANELFADGHYNWGRVVVLYAFAAWLAKHPSSSLSEDGNDDGGNDEVAKAISSAAGEFVASKLSGWISHQGGWDAMETFFEQDKSMESTVWQGLIVTLFILGTLAIVASLNR